jgi:hypothetical protein
VSRAAANPHEFASALLDRSNAAERLAGYDFVRAGTADLLVPKVPASIQSAARLFPYISN